MHIVSSGGVAEALQPSLFMPLLTRLPKQRVKAQVVALSPGCVRSAMLRQNGVPVHDIAFSRRRFSASALKELNEAVHAFRPDVLQAWGHTAQFMSETIRKRCDWNPHVVWSVADTQPLPKSAGMLDRQKLKLAAKAAAKADRVVYTSEAAAAHHRRAGFPEAGYVCISPGVDAARFKPDAATRRKLREQLHVPQDAFVIGMVAPFQPEYDHGTLLKAIGELIKVHPSLYVLLAGHGVQRGNAALMAMVGGGTLGTRTQPLGEWSDLSAFFNACDLVCSSALSDVSRMTLAMAMLCGIPCVATGMGAQGEMIGQFGVAIEPGSPSAFMRGITKVLQMTPEKRAHMAQGARKHALQNFVYVRSLQKYLQLYGDLVGREALAEAIPTPVVDTSEPIAPPPKPEQAPPPKDHAAVVAEMADPDSLETKAESAAPEALPQWRIEQERRRAEQDARWEATRPTSDGDVLQIFEMELAKPSTPSVSIMDERARGVADEFEELLPVEAITLALADEKPEAKPEPKPGVNQGAAKAAAESSAKPDAQEISSLEITQPVADLTLESAPPARARDVQAVAAPESADQKSPVAATANAASEPQPESSLDTTAEAELVDSLLSNATASAESSQTTASNEANVNAMPEPEQQSLFDLELLPEPEKKAVSG